MALGIIIIGLIFIALGIILSLPFIGIGTFIPFIGDILDVVISFALISVGLAFLIAGLGYFIAENWWAVALGLIVWAGIVAIKIYAGKKRRH